MIPSGAVVHTGLPSACHHLECEGAIPSWGEGVVSIHLLGLKEFVPQKFGVMVLPVRGFL